MSKRVLPLVALLVLAGAAGASAQTCVNVPPATSCTAAQTARLVIPSLVSLDLGAGTFDLTAPTPADLATTYVLEAGSPTITVKANKAWTLSISSAAANFTYVGTEPGAKSRDDLYWKADAVGANLGAYTQLTAAAIQVTAGIATNNDHPLIFFGTHYVNNFADPGNLPGTYTLPLTFTLAAP